MKSELKFFKCQHCGNIIEMVENSGVPVVCCGEKMTELAPGTSDGAAEKHVPVIHIDGSKVKVKIGSVEHPMIEEHHIAWIVLQTEQGSQRKYLDHTGAPEANFAVTDCDKVVAAYEYCNIHGLWKAEV